MGGGYFTKNKISFYFNLNDISKVVDILDDEYSKNLYLSAICNYVSKTQGFLISLYYGNIWKYYYLLAKAKTSHKITINYFDYFLYDLSLINLAPLKLYYSQLGIFADFYLEQYSYKHIIKANAGDFVIDGGACYGDTALYFSNLVGESGKVFAFEFVSENIEIFNNISAPVEKGQKVGELTFKINDKQIAKVDLIASKDVPKYSLTSMIGKIYNTWFTLLRK